MAPFLSRALWSLSRGKSCVSQLIRHNKNSGCQCLTTISKRDTHQIQIQIQIQPFGSSPFMRGLCNINNYNYNYVQTRKFLGYGDGEEGVLTRNYEEKRVLG
ncbi:hypothetical protein TanjilG_09806 [Lupinus angustifolius]|nr:hypothetical protein TanjilG_09806 [Lupinus angustifolius]